AAVHRPWTEGRRGSRTRRAPAPLRPRRQRRASRRLRTTRRRAASARRARAWTARERCTPLTARRGRPSRARGAAAPRRSCAGTRGRTPGLVSSRRRRHRGLGTLEDQHVLVSEKALAGHEAEPCLLGVIDDLLWIYPFVHIRTGSAALVREVDD